jgi:hypothetical protein
VNVFILFGQRNQGYPGQYAPEALEIMDEFAYEENGVWLHDKLAELEKTKEFEGLRIIEINLGASVEGIREIVLGIPKLNAKGIVECEHDYKPIPAFSALWDVEKCAKCGHESAKFNEDHP